ncbi:MAG: hypothetical protein CMJ87_06380, partial [Planctomycetes bacterium]|nr:hypothetical protein [Planctomycetota bacterium]
REVGKLEDNRESFAKLLRVLADLGERPDDKKASVDEGRHVLSRWLSAPVGGHLGMDPVASRGAAPPLTRFILPLGIAGGLLGVLLWYLGSAFWQLPLGLAAGLIVAALLKGRRAAQDPTSASQGNPRADQERAYPSDLAAPDAWDEAAVMSRLRELEETGAQWADWNEMERERKVVKNELAELDDKHQAAALRLQTLCATLGLDLELPATEQYLFAKRLDRLARKELDQQQLLGEMESCSARLQQFMAHINSDLAALDEEELADPVEVLPALSSLRQRSTDLVNARKQGAVARADLAALDEQAANLEQKLAQLYAAAGLEPGQYSDLSALVEQVEHYKDTVETRKALTRTISETAKSLPEEGSEQLLALGSSELEDELELAQAAQEKHTACEGEIHEIEAEVAHAKRHSTMRDALARRQRAVEDLSSDYDDALDGLAGRMLLERALAHHERDQAPPVLQRARKLFGRFTDHAYELRVPAAGSGSFTAYQVNTKQVRRPAELSTGTRAQLFIAARLAFTEVVHEGQQLPIVLDEALDHSDPTRFASIVASLGELSQPKAEGSRPRQLIYLTSDPQDAQRIELALEFAGYAAPHHIDLGELRDMAQETLSMAEFIPPKGSPPPPPGKLDAAEYGALLGVTPLAPANGAQAQHLFHLLADDLNVLHELLSARIETVGECRAAFGNDSDFAESIEGRLREEPTIIQRCELLDEFCSAWNSGRGRPITREVLLGVEGLADSWHEKLWPMIEELKGDGRAFISRLRAKSDERSKNIRGNTVDDIECSLMDSGHVSDSPVLTDNQVCQHVQASSAAACLSAPRVAALAKRWCAQAQLFPADSER